MSQLASKKTRNPKSLYPRRASVWRPEFSPLGWSHNRCRGTSRSIQDVGVQGPRLQARKPTQPLNNPSCGLPSHAGRLLTLQHRGPPCTGSSHNRQSRTGASAHLSLNFPLNFSSPASPLLWWEADSGPVEDAAWLTCALSGKEWSLRSQSPHPVWPHPIY